MRKFDRKLTLILIEITQVPQKIPSVSSIIKMHCDLLGLELAALCELGVVHDVVDQPGLDEVLFVEHELLLQLVVTA